MSVADATKAADTIMMLVPDHDGRTIYDQIRGSESERGQDADVRSRVQHHFKEILPPANVDVSMIAPKSPGHLVRSRFEAGRGVPALVAIHQDASGQALANALAYGMGIGCARAGDHRDQLPRRDRDRPVRRTVGTVRRSLRVDQGRVRDSGERRLPAGNGLLRMLARAQLIVDLINRGGLKFMRYSISDTAEYGDYTRGSRIITDSTRAEMKKILGEVQSGQLPRSGWPSTVAAARTSPACGRPT